jgi:DNA-binding NarL/FixJ family response regulator
MFLLIVGYVFGMFKGGMGKPRIVLADDHDVIRRGIRSLLDLTSSWDICAEVSNGREAVEKVVELKADLVIMDVSMPVMNGIEATRQIRAVSPSTKVVIFTMHDSPQITTAARDAGAVACLTKTSLGDQLQRVVAEVLASDALAPVPASAEITNGYTAA